MIDGTALPKPQRQPPEQTPGARLTFPAQSLQAVLIVLGIGLATFVLSLYVLPTSQMDAARVRIASLREQKAVLERENAALLHEIALHSNMKTLEIRAKALGMGPAANTIYLTMPASSTTPVTAYMAAPAGVESSFSPATLREWLQPEHWQDLLRELRLRVSQGVDDLIARFETQ